MDDGDPEMDEEEGEGTGLRRAQEAATVRNWKGEKERGRVSGVVARGILKSNRTVRVGSESIPRRARFKIFCRAGRREGEAVWIQKTIMPLFLVHG